MKKIFLILSGVVLVSVFAGHAYAFTPAENPVQKVDWNLSKSVMPVPPYGSQDIPGSDTASRLSVKQSFCKTDVKIKGVMRNLVPETTYTVYLSNGYTKYIPTNVEGTYNWLVLGTYSHDLFITHQNSDGTFSGTGGYPAGANPYTYTEAITGQVIGDQISLTTTYTPGPYSVTATGTIASDGSMSGTSPWEWHTTAGHAAPASGSTGWPGLFTNTIQPFTFKTNKKGVGNWHINLGYKNFQGSGPYNLSVWVNGNGGTLLISNNFKVTTPEKQCRDERNRWYDDHDEFDHDED